MAALDWAKCSVDTLAKRREMQARVSGPPRTVGVAPGTILTRSLTKKLVADHLQHLCSDREEFKKALCGAVLYAVKYGDVGPAQRLVRQSASIQSPVSPDRLFKWIELNTPLAIYWDEGTYEQIHLKLIRDLARVWRRKVDKHSQTSVIDKLNRVPML